MSTCLRCASFAVACVSLVAFSLPACAQVAPPTITVFGEAETSVAAETVMISATIESSAEQVPEARSRNNQTTETILKFLKEQGVKASKIKTSLIEIDIVQESDEFYSEKGKPYPQPPQAQSNDPFGTNASPRSEDEPPAKTIYRAERQLAITGLELSAFEEIYCGILTRGINRKPKVVLQNSSPKTHFAKVQADAVKVAAEKARLMADSLQLKLINVKTIVDLQSNNGRGGGRAYDPFDGGPANDAAGINDVTYRAKVEIVFTLSEAAGR